MKLHKGVLKNGKIPETFILGAASSAWQTEGWQGKKKGKIRISTAGTKKNDLSGIMATGRLLRRILWKSFQRMLN